MVKFFLQKELDSETGWICIATGTVIFIFIFFSLSPPMYRKSRQKAVFPAGLESSPSNQTKEIHDFTNDNNRTICSTRQGFYMDLDRSEVIFPSYE